MDLAKLFYRDLLYYPVAWLQAGNVRGYQKVLARTEFGDRGDLYRIQQERLRQLLAHARAHVPFYAEAGLPETSGIDLASLPCLTKADLQGAHARLQSTARLGRLVTKTTGGSTGQPVTLTKCRDALAWELAATWRGYGWAGITAGDRQARFWGVPHDGASQRKAHLIDTVCNRMRMSAFQFGDEDLRRYVDRLNGARPRYFYGYVSMLTQFARFLQRENLTLEFPLTCVITTSEVLGDPDRDLLREVLGAPVFNEYGCGELGTVAHECEAGALHLSEENMIVEVLDGDRTCGDGEAGELVITELNNVAFPLIRYRTGDFGAVTGQICRCGRSLRVLQSIQGRAYDFIRNRRGDLFHGEFIMYIFEDLRRQGAAIKQFQVIQTDLDAFRVRLVPDAGYDSWCEAVIVERLREKVDAGARVEFEYIDEVVREKSGKLRLIKGLE